MQGGVGQKDVDRAVGSPLAEIGLAELQPARNGQRTGVGDHLGGAVDPQDVGVRPTRQQPGRGGSWAAAEIDDLARTGVDDTRQQLGPRTFPLVLVLEVLLRVPADGHGWDVMPPPGAYEKDLVLVFVPPFP
jgi:hypothetical protein